LPKGSNAKLVVTQLKSIFARFGIPMEIISDNGPPFNAQEFKLFGMDWGINMVTSSPNYPQSNGLTERCVQIVKKLLKKACDTNTDPYIALMQYRNTANNNLFSCTTTYVKKS
jgi:transposase InsO family protein